MNTKTIHIFSHLYLPILKNDHIIQIEKSKHVSHKTLEMCRTTMGPKKPERSLSGNRSNSFKCPFMY